MNSYQYDKPLRESYRLPAAATTTAGVLGRFIGPAGRVGRVVNISHIVTTAVTVAADVISVGPNGAAAPVLHSVGVSLIAAGGAISRTAASLLAQTELPADTVVEIATNGASTLGAADINVTVEWY